MSRVHGKNTVIKVATVDISTYADSSELEVGADEHDVTTYGKDDHVYDGGLGNHTFKCSGTYDSSAVSGPRALLKPLVGTVAAVVRQPEGTGSGKPQDAFNWLITKYVETNPVADFIKWSAEGKVSDAIDDTPQ